MVLSNNTSGLNGIRFGWQEFKSGAYPYVYVMAKGRHGSISVNRNGQSGALQRAIEARKAAGLPAPTMDEALQALRRFLGTRGL